MNNNMPKTCASEERARSYSELSYFFCHVLFFPLKFASFKRKFKVCIRTFCEQGNDHLHTAYSLTLSPHRIFRAYYVISSAVQEIVEGPAVFGVSQAVECDPI